MCGSKGGFGTLVDSEFVLNHAAIDKQGPDSFTGTHQMVIQ